MGDGDQDDGEPGTEEFSLGDFTDGDLVASEVSITERFCDSRESSRDRRYRTYGIVMPPSSAATGAGGGPVSDC